MPGGGTNGGMAAELQVVTHHLEMTSLAELRPSRGGFPEVSLQLVTAFPPWFYRDLYRGVGRSYNWFRRYHWSDADIQLHFVDPSVKLYVLYDCGDAAGFAELRRREADDSVEIQYFGLLPRFVGRGLGGHLLTAATRAAWATGPRRVWLHTCSLDHPAALANYQARGFRIYRTEAGTEPALEVEAV